MVRLALEQDAEGIAKIESENFAHPWKQQDIIDSMNADTVFALAEENGKIVAYCGIQCTKFTAFITTFAVLKDYRKQGYGTAVLNEIRRIAKQKGIGEISLEVRVSNIPAISLYEKSGYKNMGVRKNFYRTPKEDAYIYTLTI